MEITLAGRKAIVTGSTRSGSSKMGYGIAKQLANAGASVVLNGRSRDRVDEAVEQLCGELPGAEVTGVLPISPTPPISAGYSAVP
jgi:NAD(P)-dependent dehydrogenase (short-subunit alcohol dehydrogenase family)